MNKNFCPNCGAPLKPNSSFCPSCGYQLSKQSSINAGYGNNNSSQSKSPTGWIILILLIFLISVFSGVFVYNKFFNSNTEPKSQNHQITNSKPAAKSSSTVSSHSKKTTINNNNHLNNSERNISANDTDTLLSDTFTKIGDSVTDSDEDFSNDFVGSTSNPSYQQIKNWVDIQSANSKIDSVTIDVSNVVVNGSNVTFKAKYDFYHGDEGNDHIQIFNWNGKIQNANGRLLITSCQSDSKPISDYYE